MKPRILVIGDAIVDRTLHGHVERVNPEAPGTVFRVERQEDRPGGAAAVAMLCESLGAEVETAFGEPRCIKQRCVADGRLLHDRIDFDVASGPAELKVTWPPDTVLVADYGKGAIRTNTVPYLRSLWPKTRIVVDPAMGRKWGHYAGATVIKANSAEAEAEHPGIHPFGPEGCAVVVTRGRDGIELTVPDEKWSPIHKVPGRPTCLVDSTGAGDTVAAVLAVCLAKGIDLPRACELANIAGAIQVSRLGVAPITWDEIEPRRRVVVANGCFDLLHAGHVAMLEFAKAQGDWLTVLVNSDASVRRLKGPSRPIVPQDQRVAMLRSLRCVDEVRLFDADTPAELLCQISPDVLVKGEGSNPTDGQEFAKRVVFAPLVEGVSTTLNLARANRQE